VCVCTCAHVGVSELGGASVRVHTLGLWVCVYVCAVIVHVVCARVWASCVYGRRVVYTCVHVSVCVYVG